MKLWLTPQEVLVCAVVFDPVSLAALHDTGQKIGTNEANETAMKSRDALQLCQVHGVWRLPLLNSSPNSHFRDPYLLDFFWS